MEVGKRVARACLVILTLPVVGAGCLSGSTPRDHFYRLAAGAPEAALPAPPLAGTVEVGRFRTDALTGERSMLYRESRDATEIHRYAYHRWADPPATMLQGALAHYLRTAGAADLVVTPELRVKPDFYVSGRILRLERIAEASSPQVVVELELGVTRGRGDDLLVLKIYREERPAGGRAVAQSVVAFNEALTAIFERFLADLAGS